MMRSKIWRLGIFDKEELVGTALISKIIAKRGTFLLIQHGPNTKISNFQFPISKHEIFKTLLEKLKEIAKEEGASFIRIAPLLKKTEENKKMLQVLGLREAPMHANAYEATLKLDLNLSEEELLMNMRKTTRYLIRQASKDNDTEIYQSLRLEDVETFDELQQEVVKKQHFVPFSFEHLKNEFSIFKNNNQIALFLGKYKGEIIAGAFVLFWSKIGFYHHAALLPQYNKIPITYLLQWEAIKEAKKRGCSFYDFWGFTDPQKYPKHPWAGPTLFKMGFRGEVHSYAKTQDFPLSKTYWLTFLFEKLRKSKRGLQ